MSTPFNQGASTIPVVLNTSNCFVFGNTASGNALSVQQFGTGNVVRFSNVAGGSNVLVMNNLGQVGIGTASPAYPLHVVSPGTTVYLSNTALQTTLNAQIGRINFGNGGSDASIASCVNVGGANNNTDLRFYTSEDYVNQNIERMRIDRNGFVGIGTTTPGQTLTVGTGGTVNFSNAMYTQFNTVTGASAATITAGFNTGSGPTPNTPTAGEYQWTIGTATTYGNIVSLGLYPPGATFRWTFTARSTSTPVYFNFQTVANSVYAFTSPTLTSSYQTFTWTATIPSNGDRTCYFGVNGTASGQNIIWNSFTATRIDTIITGNVGIGNTAPLNTLHVGTTGNGGGILVTGDSNTLLNLQAVNSGVLGSGVVRRSTVSMKAADTTDKALQFFNNSTDLIGLTDIAYKFLNNIASTTTMSILNNGNVGIGTTTPGSYLEISATGANHIANGTLRFYRSDAATLWKFTGPDTGNTLYLQNAGGTGVYITNGSTTWTGTSDSRLKNIIGPISNALIKVNILNPVMYSWKNDETNDPHPGLIAQDVLKVQPEAVSTNSEGMYGVAYTELIPLAFAAIKELSEENTALKARLDALESRLGPV